MWMKAGSLATSRTSKFNITRRQFLHVPWNLFAVPACLRNPHEKGKTKKERPTREKKFIHENLADYYFLPFPLSLSSFFEPPFCVILRLAPILRVYHSSKAEILWKRERNLFSNIAEMLCAKLIISSMVCVFDFSSDSIDFRSSGALSGLLGSPAQPIRHCGIEVVNWKSDSQLNAWKIRGDDISFRFHPESQLHRPPRRTNTHAAPFHSCFSISVNEWKSFATCEAFFAQIEGKMLVLSNSQHPRYRIAHSEQYTPKKIRCFRCVGGLRMASSQTTSSIVCKTGMT